MAERSGDVMRGRAGFDGERRIYMAPEQILAPASVGGQADVYALGVILYEVLCGQVPFESREPMAVMVAKKYDDPRPLSLFAPKLQPALLTLVMRMLAREPAERPEMAEVEIDLRLAAGLPLPRQTGAHNALDCPDPTADVPADVINVAHEAPPTPSEPKGNGEISPRSLHLDKIQPNAPASLSDMPSVPVQMPPYKLSPEVSTPQRAPSPLPVAERILTAASTKFEPPRPVTVPLPVPEQNVSAEPEPSSRRTLLLVGVIAALGAAAAATVAAWPRLSPAPPIAAVSQAPVAPTPPPVSTPAPPVFTPTNPTPPSSPAVTAAKPAEPVETTEKPSSALTKATSRGCTLQFPDDACIVTDMNRDQRAQLLRAVGGIKLCPGERLLLSGIPHNPKIDAAPHPLSRTAPNATT